MSDGIEVSVMACMGGWCSCRERCGWYMPGMEWRDEELSQRLCQPGEKDAFVPIAWKESADVGAV